eukprot:g16552.t1
MSEAASVAAHCLRQDELPPLTVAGWATGEIAAELTAAVPSAAARTAPQARHVRGARGWCSRAVELEIAEVPKGLKAAWPQVFSGGAGNEEQGAEAVRLQALKRCSRVRERALETAFESCEVALQEESREGPGGVAQATQGYCGQARRPVTSRSTKGKDGKVLLENSRIRERGKGHFGQVRNTKSHTLDPPMADTVKPWPTRVPLGDLPSLFEVEEAIKGKGNRKAVGPDDLLAEPIKLCMDADQEVCVGEFAEDTRMMQDMVTTSEASSCEEDGGGQRNEHGLRGDGRGGPACRGGQESERASNPGEDLVALGMEDKNEGEGWKKSAEEWVSEIEDGVARFMRKWHAQEKSSILEAPARESGGGGGGAIVELW